MLMDGDSLVNEGFPYVAIKKTLFISKGLFLLDKPNSWFYPRPISEASGSSAYSSRLITPMRMAYWVSSAVL